MHLALPPRKSSRGSPPYYNSPRPSTTTSYLRRVRLRPVAGILTGLLCLIILLSQFRSGRSPMVIKDVPPPPGTPNVVLVTTLESSAHEKFKDMIIDNRRQYAALHGYATFLPDVTDYPLRMPKVVHSGIAKAEIQSQVPSSWTKVPAVRHAMTLFPHSTYFFYLDRAAMVVNPSLSLEEHITNKARLESLMIPDQSIVPPESVIKTLRNQRAERVDFIVTQDREGLSEHSFIVRRGDWAQYFLDAWFDPLYRSYNFARAEGHALEHLVQWHGTILARLALIPQTILNSYVQGQQDEQFEDGHFIAHAKDCDVPGHVSCENALKLFYQQFQAALPASSSQ